ncbi:MAG: tRNA (guanosine(46)-N7)-methyltransferase TrmB [Fibrobacteres bacterium]|nr:tRNA (guanosine(46)-N7)-methyltransferase TrmB [Fibrobacterota bacterium]
MNRYKKKVVLKKESEEFILPFIIPSKCKDLNAHFIENPPKRLDYSAIFGNTNPIEIEVGFGTGKFLTSAGKLFPAINYIGLEITRKMVQHVANQAHDGALSNVRVVLCDGRLYMKYVVPSESVSRVHVYFPDPWTKKRHLKRRVINQEFFDSAYSVLKDGAYLNLYTDHKEYFEYFLEQRNIFGRFKDTSDMGFYTPTGYEQKWTREGRDIYRAVLQK